MITSIFKKKGERFLVFSVGFNKHSIWCEKFVREFDSMSDAEKYIKSNSSGNFQVKRIISCGVVNE